MTPDQSRMEAEESRVDALAAIARGAGLDADVILALAVGLRQRQPSTTRARVLVELLGLRVADRPLDWAFAVAVHEACHFVASRANGVAVSTVEISWDVGSLGRITHPSPTLGTIAPLSSRIDADVAGACGEHSFLGGVDPGGANKDLRTALARLGWTSVDAPPAEPIAALQRACVRVREVLATHWRSVMTLACALLDRHELSVDEALAELDAAGCPVPFDGQVFDTVPQAERERVAQAFGEPPPPAWTPIKVPVHTVESFRAALATAAPTLETPRMQRMLARQLAKADAMTFEDEGP